MYKPPGNVPQSRVPTINTLRGQLGYDANGKWAILRKPLKKFLDHCETLIGHQQETQTSFQRPSPSCRDPNSQGIQPAPQLPRSATPSFDIRFKGTVTSCAVRRSRNWESKRHFFNKTLAEILEELPVLHSFTQLRFRLSIMNMMPYEDTVDFDDEISFKITQMIIKEMIEEAKSFREKSQALVSCLVIEPLFDSK